MQAQACRRAGKERAGLCPPGRGMSIPPGAPRGGWGRRCLSPNPGFSGASPPASPTLPDIAGSTRAWCLAPRLSKDPLLEVGMGRVLGPGGGTDASWGDPPASAAPFGPAQSAGSGWRCRVPAESCPRPRAHVFLGNPFSRCPCGESAGSLESVCRSRAVINGSICTKPSQLWSRHKPLCL